MFYGCDELWNLRDKYMFEILNWIIKYWLRSMLFKVIVWVYNSYIGDVCVISMGWLNDEFNIG